MVPHGSSNQFQAFYPIVTPPVGYQEAVPSRHPPAPSGPALRPADSYRPNYGRGNGRPAARHADVEESPSDHEVLPADKDHPMPSPEARNADLDLPATPPEALFDTGATHHLTGDKLALHDLKLL
jgi:hypothetical protein